MKTRMLFLAILLAGLAPHASRASDVCHYANGAHRLLIQFGGTQITITDAPATDHCVAAGQTDRTFREIEISYPGGAVCRTNSFLMQWNDLEFSAEIHMAPIRQCALDLVVETDGLPLPFGTRPRPIFDPPVFGAGLDLAYTTDGSATGFYKDQSGNLSAIPQGAFAEITVTPLSAGAWIEF